MSFDRKICDKLYYMRHRDRIKRATRAYALTEKGRDVQNRAQAKYRKTSGSRAAKQRYKRTLKGKLTAARSDKSSKGKERHRRYLQTDHARQLRRAGARRSFLKRIYGLTELEYYRLCRIQNNRCKICNKYTRKLCVDHKKKGSYRGLLCNTCNVGLGMFTDSIKSLQSAIRYLKAA